jgi:hypothetical protein
MLLSETKNFRVDSESAANAMILDYQQKSVNGDFKVKKSGITHREKKSKGEIIEEWFVVSITLSYEE